MKRLCIFDLDGTLVDSVADIAAAVNRSLEKMGRIPHPTEKYYRMVGDGMEMLCRRALGDGTEEEVEHLVRLYGEDYLRNCYQNTKSYPGIPELLKDLQKEGILLAILSNKPQTQSEVVVSKVLGKGLFKEVLGAGKDFPRKPDPEALLFLMQKLGIPKEETWYIGDSDVDMQVAKAAGVKSVGVAWGFRGVSELSEAGADRIAEDAAELKSILLS